MHLTFSCTLVPRFIKCLESLQNLHTLEIGWVGHHFGTPLEDALNGIKLPQIKTLILPPVAYPLLQHCSNVEDIVFVIMDKTQSYDGSLRSLASKRNPKVKRLAIPLILWPNPSSKRFGTLQDHWVVMITNRFCPQDLLLRVRCSPNSLSSSLTYVAPGSRRRGFCLTRRVKVHSWQYQNWSLRAERSRISTHSRSYVSSLSNLIWRVGVGGSAVKAYLGACRNRIGH